MATVHLLGAKKSYDKAKTEQEERQTAQQAITITIPTAITGNFLIVDYSQKALAVFGDTRPMKEQLKALGGSFNPRLTHNNEKKAGWIFSKSKEQELMNLLTIK
jgi:lipopolysaccharide export LptBFGC system permease protein LptF